MLEHFAALPRDPSSTVSTEIHTAPVSASAPPVRILSYYPANVDGPVPALLHIHAGGYVIGAPEMMDGVNRILSADLGCAIFSVDYRLSPESKYPEPIEDWLCYSCVAFFKFRAIADRRRSHRGKARAPAAA
jgi:acetyl esterase/lipase